MTSSIRDSPLKVAVVGAGPAGCAAALTLGQENIDVILLEKGPPNKDKACGDALVPAALEMFAYFGLDEDCISELGGRRYDDISLTFGDSDIWKAQHESSQGWVIPRVVLDQRFRELTSAYAEIRYETRVTNVRRNIYGSYGVTIRRRGRYEEEKLRCSAVILANGATGKFASDVGVSGAPLIGASITAYSELKEPDGLVFRFNESYLPGYSWVFPIGPGRVNVGVCALGQRNRKQLRQLGARLLGELELDDSYQWRGGLGCLWSGAGTRWHDSGGIVSCGDAAGLVDPLSGEGISAALLSGHQAGKAVASFTQEGQNGSRLADYSQWVLRHFGHEYRTTPMRQLWGELMGT